MNHWSTKKILITTATGLGLVIFVFAIGLPYLKALTVDYPSDGFGDGFSDFPVEAPTLPGGSTSTNIPPDSGPTPSAEDIYTFSDNPDLTNFINATKVDSQDTAKNVAERQQADTQTAQQEAEKLQTQQQGDLQKCLEEGAGGGIQGPLNEALNEGLSQTVNNTLQQDLPAKLNEEIQNNLPEALNEEIKKQFPADLSAKVKAELEQTLPNAIKAASNNGAIALTQDDLKLVVKDQLENAIKNNFGDSLKTSITTGFPNAIKSSVEKSVPNAVNSVITNNLPSALARDLPNFLNNNLSDLTQALVIGGTTGIQSREPSQLSQLTQTLSPLTQLLSLIPGFGSIFQAISQGTQLLQTVDSISQQAQALVSPFSDTQVREISDKMIAEYSRVALEQLDGSMDEISNSINSELQKNLDSVLAGSLGNLDQLLDSNLDSISGQIDSSLANLFSGANNQINQSINSVINQTVNSTLGSFTGVLDQTIGQVTNFVPGLINDTMGQFTGVFNQALGNITGPITGALNNAVGSITAPITGALNNAVGSITAPITNAVNNVVGKITEPITGAMNNVVGKVTDTINNKVTEITDNVVGGLTDKVTESLQAPLEGALNNVTSGLASSIPGVGVLAAAAGIGIYVPVQEQSGALLSTTQSIDSHSASIDETTQTIKELTVEICTQLKSIKRIQTAFEQKEFVEDPNLRRQAGNEVNSYRAELKSLTDQGYDSTGQGPDAPLYVQNTRAHINEVVLPEATGVFLDDLKKSEDIWKENTASVLVGDLSNEINKSTISKDDYNRFIKGGVQDSDTWFKYLLAITNPFIPNSPETSYRINKTTMVQKQFQAEQDSLAEINAGQGYLPVRQCVEYTTDGKTCRRWETVTPATQVRESNASALDYRLNLYTDPQQGDVAPQNGPSIEETRTFQPATTGGGGSGPGSSGISEIISLITSLFGGGGSGAGGVSNPAPTITLAKSTPAPGSTSSRITWTSTNASACKTTNDWITGGNSSGFFTINPSTNTSLPTSGNRAITPINFGLRFIRVRSTDTITPERSLEVEEVLVGGIITTKKLTLPAGSFQVGDIIKISLYPFIPNTEVSKPVLAGETGAEVLSALYTQALEAKAVTNNLTLSSTFKQFDFVTGGEVLTVAPKIEYTIACQNSSGQTVTKSLSLN